MKDLRKAPTLAELLGLLEQLEADGHDMTEHWWGWDGGTLETPTLTIDSGFYDRD